MSVLFSSFSAFCLSRREGFLFFFQSLNIMCWDYVLPRFPGLVFHHSQSGGEWRHLFLTKDCVGFEQK